MPERFFAERGHAFSGDATVRYRLFDGAAVIRRSVVHGSLAVRPEILRRLARPPRGVMWHKEAP